MWILIIALIVPRPITNLKGYDKPNDAGGAIELEWQLSPDDSVVSVYEVYRSDSESGPFEFVGSLRGNSYLDNNVKDGKKYYYFVRAKSEKYGTSSDSEIIGPVVPKAQWFNRARLNALLIGLIFTILVIAYIKLARTGAELFLRRIPGLDAVDEAVGRSTEMGRPIMFILGLGMISDIATLAALSILGRVAKKAAEYGTRVLVPCYDPIVMTAAQEIVKQAHQEAGRPDIFRREDIFYLTSDQFGYAAGCDGIMLRERPGAVFLQGYFYAESLILAETGHSVGAIQIAGTSAVTQLPFFIAACDYTLIGEEMFAASTYLSREPLMLGSIKAEDFTKMILLGLIIIGIILASLGKVFPGFERIAELFINFFKGA